MTTTRHLPSVFDPQKVLFGAYSTLKYRVPSLLRRCLWLQVATRPCSHNLLCLQDPRAENWPSAAPNPRLNSSHCQDRQRLVNLGQLSPPTIDFFSFVPVLRVFVTLFKQRGFSTLRTFAALAKYHFSPEIFCARNNLFALAQGPIWFIKFCSALLAAPLLKVPKGTFCEVGCAVES